MPLCYILLKHSDFLNSCADIWHVCESCVLRSGFYHHAGVYLEQEEPKRAHEFLWPFEFPGALSPMGAHGILSAAGKLHHCGPFR